MKCGIQKNVWLDDDYVLEKVGVMCALLVLHTIVFEVSNIFCRMLGFMCALLVIYTIVFEIKNIFCRMLGLCVHCWFYIL
jgi:hypothetical protein